MTLRRCATASAVLVAVALAISAWVYPMLPERVASHWGVDGQVNGYSSRTFATIFVPALMAVLAALLLALPRLDPLRRNIESFRATYHRFVLVLLAFLLILHAVTIAWNLGYQVSIGTVLPVLLGGVFFAAGHLMQRSERNWFIGLRTPWTLSSDEVWRAANGRAGLLFKACGVVAILSALVPSYSFWFIIVPVLVATLYSVAYSYVLYRRQAGR